MDYEKLIEQLRTESLYAECEKYHCKNFKWRGQKKD